jgi:hypothetical protein
MSLQADVAAVLANCAHIPQLPYANSYPLGQWRLVIKYTVNRLTWRTFFPIQLDVEAPSPPAVFRLKFYENKATMPITDPILNIGGFLATCASSTNSLGTTAWIEMATLTFSFTGNAPVTLDWVHIQTGSTNVGSIGLFRSGHPPP